MRHPAPLTAFAVLLGLSSAAYAANAPAPLTCAIAPTTATSTAPVDPRARDAAQHGINFLSKATSEWANTNHCYGCHVQAVTLEALSVGKHSQYDVPATEFSVIKNSILNDNGGSRGPQGLWHSGFPKTARTFGGAALARYDQYVGNDLQDDLIQVANQLLAYQVQDGSVHGDHQAYPVTTGVMQATYQAMQTWRQAYTRTADNVWLAPIQKAERYIHKTAEDWDALKGAVYLQDINYALLGLTAAGVSRSEDVSARLIRFLSSQQNADGGYGFTSGTSDAFATGQTVYSLRTAGLGEQDRSVSRGISWLIKNQKSDGGWGAAGSGKAEAMWALLGLVSVDVMSVNIKGLADGERVHGSPSVTVDARDNKAGGMSRVELIIDDVKVAEACGGTLNYAWNTKDLTDGKHIVDAVGVNAKGLQSRRRMEVFSGNVFVTQLGSRFTDNATHVTFRNLAQKQEPGTVRMNVFALTPSQQRGAQVWSGAKAGEPGAMEFAWDGRSQDGKVQEKGRYVAELQYVDANGKTVQSETVQFFQDTAEAEKAQFAEVKGNLSVRGAAPAANTKVDLVDERGNIVQSTTTTEAGEYRFKSVEGGKYKVRVKKDGFKQEEAPVEAKKAAEASASMSLH